MGPHSGVRPFHKRTTCFIELTLGPYVLQIWSRNNPECAPNKTFGPRRAVRGPGVSMAGELWREICGGRFVVGGLWREICGGRLWREIVPEDCGERFAREHLSRVDSREITSRVSGEEALACQRKHISRVGGGTSRVWIRGSTSRVWRGGHLSRVDRELLEGFPADALRA
jgi:hypothetical protein